MYIVCVCVRGAFVHARLADNVEINNPMYLAGEDEPEPRAPHEAVSARSQHALCLLARLRAQPVLTRRVLTERRQPLRQPRVREHILPAGRQPHGG